ncbi:hypothetical protein, partial [uncultured Lamprocystis sp.]|uniref:hypothetical protein n=1 Tax=uncultured Lamprocystis sp. TaxID=543132 RepID=UPI0025F09B92
MPVQVGQHRQVQRGEVIKPEVAYQHTGDGIAQFRLEPAAGVAAQHCQFGHPIGIEVGQCGHLVRCEVRVVVD